MNRPEVLALLEEHITELSSINQANNQMEHLLDLSGLKQPSITIFTARDSTSNELMGCAALKEIIPFRGELKSMRTVSSHQRKGAGSAILNYLILAAKSRGYDCLSLETGSQEQFIAAQDLYKKRGFVPYEPYEGYEDAEPVQGSVFMSYRLD
jgi:putative acetyltransferase